MEVVRRLVARTKSQQLTDAVQETTAPFQCAMTTKAGCRTHFASVASIHKVEPQCNDFVSGRHKCVWHDVTKGDVAGIGQRRRRSCCSAVCQHVLWGTVEEPHTIDQGEGGEQGDASLPLLYSLGQHGALQHLHSEEELREGETLLAFLDDTHVDVPCPDKTATVHAALQEAMFSTTGIRINPGKTEVWNAAGVKPSGCGVFQRIAETYDPTAVRGSELPTHGQGLKVLGTPLGHHDFVKTSLEMKNIGHQFFLDRIPLLEKVQASWLLSVSCAVARANYMTRVVEPGATRDFSERNDETLWQCLCQIMRISLNTSEDIRLTASLLMVLDGARQESDKLLIGPVGLIVHPWCSQAGSLRHVFSAVREAWHVSSVMLCGVGKRRGARFLLEVHFIMAQKKKVAVHFWHFPSQSWFLALAPACLFAPLPWRVGPGAHKPWCHFDLLSILAPSCATSCFAWESFVRSVCFSIAQTVSQSILPSVFSSNVLPNISWSLDFRTNSSPPFDCWMVFCASLLGWPSCSPNAVVFLESGWPDVLHLDGFHLTEIFERRAHVMRVVPHAAFSSAHQGSQRVQRNFFWPRCEN